MPGERARRRRRADLDIDERERLLEPGWPKMAFIEHRLAGDPTNWWAPNARRASRRCCAPPGLEVVARPGHEIWLCRPRGGFAHQAELLAATGGVAEE